MGEREGEVFSVFEALMCFESGVVERNKARLLRDGSDEEDDLDDEDLDDGEVDSLFFPGRCSSQDPEETELEICWTAELL